ncbi:MAG: hypothetical protein HY247_01380 [archaeon]|nr:MAG: hypothetical protein HY247_01380 [archaeon]
MRLLGYGQRKLEAVREVSVDKVSRKAKETLKVLKEAVENAQETVRKEVDRAAPSLQKSMDSSLDSAAKGFSSAMKTIDTTTEREQLGLLRAYRKFLSGQSDYVDSRVRSLEERSRAKKPAA